MKRAPIRLSRLCAAVVFILLGIFPAFAQNLGKPFAEAKGLPDQSLPTHFQFAHLNFAYRIEANGDGKRTSSNNAITSFSLGLAPNDHVERSIYYSEYQGDLLVICEVSDHESGSGFLARLDGKSLIIKWKRAIPAFNLGPGLIENSNAYVTALGFIGKIDLRSGRYVWRHDNLYGRKDRAFNSFQLPKIIGDRVVFTEAELYSRNKVAVVEVRKLDGKIIKQAPW